MNAVLRHFWHSRRRTRSDVLGAVIAAANFMRPWQRSPARLHSARCSGGGFLMTAGLSLRPAASSHICARPIRTHLSFGSVQLFTQPIASSAYCRNSSALDMTLSRLSGMPCNRHLRQPTVACADGTVGVCAQLNSDYVDVEQRLRMSRGTNIGQIWPPFVLGCDVRFQNVPIDSTACGAVVHSAHRANRIAGAKRLGETKFELCGKLGDDGMR
jgi:hypothetical protein